MKIVLLTDKEKADWDKARKPLLKLREEYMKRSCARCVWSDNSSGRILCTRDCPRKGRERKSILRGEIYYADLSPVMGSEQDGLRPVLIVQNDVGNRHSPTVIIVPLSAKKKKHLPVHIDCDSQYLPSRSVILTEQIRTIDRARLREYVGRLDSYTMSKVDRALKISTGVT